MSTNEGAITAPTPDVSGIATASGTTTPADSSPAPVTTDSPSQAGVQPQSVQGEQPQTQEDPLAGLPTTEEIQKAIEQELLTRRGWLK